MKAESLIIKSQGGKSGSRMQWTAFGDNIRNFTDGIGYKPNQELETTKPKISNAVSGMPTVFARANLFTNALLAGNTEAKNFGMNQFYSQLLDEWKGLIAAFVLEDNKSLWKVKRVLLNYSDGDGTINGTKNIYEPKGAFGNSLFNRKQLWEDPSAINIQDRIPKPFIDVIYYNGKVVGGTSPECLVFTSPGYEFQSEDRGKLFISATTGKFADPLVASDKLSPQKLSELYNYVVKLSSRVKEFYDKYEKSKKLWPDALVDEKLVQVLGKWQDEIQKQLSKHNVEKTDTAKPEVAFFELEPFKSLFNVINAYYADFQGSIFSEEDSRPLDCIEFKLEELLLNKETTEVARIAVEDVEHLPINILKDANGSGTFFTIPLSPLGLKIFQREGKLESLIGNKGTNNSSTLTAFYKPNHQGKQILTVRLDLRKDNGASLPPVELEYDVAIKTIDPFETNQLIVWPNFVSSYWNKYYFYSEMPHNNPTGWAVYPILGNINNSDNVVELIDKELGMNLGFKKMMPEKSYEFLKIADKDLINDELGAILVGNIKTLSSFKYEIYESAKPFRGVELRNSGKSSGYIFLKYSGDQSKNSNIQFLKDKKPEGCRVGIDFGSNNTCVAYESMGKSELIKFNNRRISFFMSDDEQNDTNKALPADTFEMLFFQNDSIDSNKIKSTLTLHDQSRMVSNGKSEEELYAEVIKGGFTSYEKNINVIDSTDSVHIVEIPRLKDQKVNIVHSMKWQEKDANHKIAFIKNLLLQTYAELFAGITGRTLFPNEVLWAYPAAMSDSRVHKYKNAVWSRLSDCNPLKGAEFKFKVASSWSQKKVKEGGLGGDSFESSSGIGMFDSTLASPNSGGGMFNDNSAGSNSSNGMFGSSQNNNFTQKSGTSSSKYIPARYPEEIAPENAWIFSPPIPIKTENILTESQAVAKYAVSVDPLSQGQYKVGIDVGGSTSDILFITGINGENVLVKQNSIKIAAGMLADATQYIPDFGGFLKTYASRNEEILGGKIRALDVINERTTPYCFNLILDRLDDENQLNQFYNEIASRCKPLFWVNMYITGLTIYYLGIVCRKVGEISHKNANPGGEGFGKGMYQVMVDFYGKGARIFDWFKAYNKDTAEEYMYSCFNKGFGKDVRSFVTFKNFENISISTKEIKSEVAKGLANSISTLAEFDPLNMIGEISGEDGYVLDIPGKDSVPYTATMEINPSLIQRLGSELSPSFGQGIPYPRFTDFMNTFYDYAKNYAEFNFSGQEMLQAIKNMNILREIQNDPDYQKAKAEKEFDFVAPLLVLEGQAFLKSYLLPKIKNG